MIVSLIAKGMSSVIGVKTRGPIDLFRSYNRKNLVSDGIRNEVSERKREESRWQSPSGP